MVDSNTAPPGAPATTSPPGAATQRQAAPEPVTDQQAPRTPTREPEMLPELATEKRSPPKPPNEPQSGILPASHWAQVSLPEEPQDDDDDSAYGDTASSTTSLSASVLEYRTLHGRTFHSDVGQAESWIPNDEQHQDSMDIHHHMCTLALEDKLFLAPLKPEKIQNVVDIGTGTGIWAIDFAEQFPNAAVIGTDVSPIQPPWVPPGVKFEIDDANLPWTWADNTFDYIHMRCLFGSIVDWSALYRDAFRCCKPGGWFEDFENSINMQSDDGSVPPGSPMDQWREVFWAGGEKFGRTFRVVEDDIQKKCMEDAGFVDITVREIKCPIGTWPSDPRLKTLGQFSKMVLDSDVEGYVLYMWNAVMGWAPEEVQVYLVHLRRQLRDKNTHAWYRQRVVYGRKPEPGEVSA